jgi:hypothetical protein
MSADDEHDEVITGDDILAALDLQRDLLEDVIARLANLEAEVQALRAAVG